MTPKPQVPKGLRVLKTLPFAAAALAAALALLLLVVPSLVSSDLAMRRIADQASAWTGRPVHFRGPVSVSFHPFLTVRVADVEIGGGNGEPPLMRAAALSGHVRLLPLLLGRVEIASIGVEQPRIALTVGAGGRPNWIGAGSGESSTPGPFGVIDIVDGTLSYADSVHGRTLVLSRLNARLAWSDARERATVAGSFTWNGQPVDLRATLWTPQALIAGAPAPLRIAVAAAPLRVSFDGSIAAAGALSGALDITTPSLRQAIAWTGKPIAVDAATLGVAALSGTLAWADSTASVTDAKLELDGNEAVGALTADLSGERPVVRATLALDSLDLTPYIEALAAQIRAAGGVASAPVAVPALAGADFDVRVSATTLLLGPARMGPFAASAMVGDRRLAIEVGDAGYHGGDLQGQLRAEMSDGQVSAQLDAAASGVALGDALAEFGAAGPLSATASGRLSVSSGGASWGDLVAGLGGTASVTLADARFKGLDLAPLGPEVGGTPVAFDTAAAEIAFSDGFARISDLRAEGTGLGLAMRASASLLRPTIAGRGAFTLPAAGETAARTVAFVLSGTWLAPVFSPDPDSLIRSDAGAGPGVDDLLR
jgi:AsmA protein